MQKITNKNDKWVTVKKTTATSAKIKGLPVSGLKVAQKGKSSIKLTWKKNSTASGYVVEMKKNGKWKKIATIKKNSTLSYVKKSMKKGTYLFRIKAYKKLNGKTYYSTYKTVKIRR